MNPMPVTSSEQRDQDGERDAVDALPTMPSSGSSVLTDLGTVVGRGPTASSRYAV